MPDAASALTLTRALPMLFSAAIAISSPAAYAMLIPAADTRCYARHAAADTIFAQRAPARLCAVCYAIIRR